MHQSIRTLDDPQFINLTPLEINPLMSKAEIKVLYTGLNRNGSFISKETATEMAKTLRGAPIVGAFKQEKEDFTDHGERVTIDDEGIHFSCATVPYGFVSPDAEVWFQTFNELDEDNLPIQREYLMTTGYLWTGQYEEAKTVFNGQGKNQSMELDSETLNGEWVTDYNNDLEFFIINDAIFSKLCILGDDVEPCFEGARVQPVRTFSKVDDSFKNTLFAMMQDLSFALKGEPKMNEEEVIVNEAPVEEAENQSAIENFTEAEVEVAAVAEEISVEENSAIEEAPVEEFKKEDKEEEAPAEDSEEEAPVEEEKDDEEEKKKYSALEEEYNTLSESYAALEQKYSLLEQEYLSYKNQIEGAEKDKLIESFSKLTDEEKADVINNKDQYSLSEIKSKLSVIYADKFMQVQDETTEDAVKEVVTTFNIHSQRSLPDWVSAVVETRDKNNK